MLGDIENGTRRHNANCGMTPRVFEHLFHRIQKVTFYSLFHVRLVVPTSSIEDYMISYFGTNLDWFSNGTWWVMFYWYYFSYYVGHLSAISGVFGAFLEAWLHN